MYTPKYFKINDEEMIYDFIEKNSFATLFSQHNGTPCASHLPLILDRGDRALYGHFARPNEQWKDAVNQTILVVFQGPHCYISPSWYETNKAVPTWNYVAIHIYGTMEMINDKERLYASLNDMVNKYESPDSSYHLDEVDPQFIEGLSKGIVGFKINITTIEAKAKLSQNHSAERQDLVIKKLENTSDQNNQQIAALMKKNSQKQNANKKTP